MIWFDTQLFSMLHFHNKYYNIAMIGNMFPHTFLPGDILSLYLNGLRDLGNTTFSDRQLKKW
jgi:hypothetical protein